VPVELTFAIPESASGRDELKSEQRRNRDMLRESCKKS
jgi:hypothetical protein